MGPHFWIKQCIELLLSTADPTASIHNCTPASHLPAVTNVINLADPSDRNAFNVLVSIKEEPGIISAISAASSAVSAADMSSAADALDKADDELADIELSNSSDVGVKR